MTKIILIVIFCTLSFPALAQESTPVPRAETVCPGSICPHTEPPPLTAEDMEEIKKELKEADRQIKESEKKRLENEKALEWHKGNIFGIWNYLMGYSLQPPSPEEDI